MADYEHWLTPEVKGQRMTRYLIPVFVLVVSLVAVGQSSDPEITHNGNGILLACGTKNTLSTDVEKANYGYCIGLIEGVSRMLQLGESKHELAVCYPDGVTIKQEIGVVVKYVGDHSGKNSVGFQSQIQSI